MTPLLEARGVGIDGRLGPTDLMAGAGEFVAIVGPNGGGKTSLLRALARVEGAGGIMTIDGEQLDAVGEARRRRLIAFLPASRDIAWPIRVRDFIALGLGGSDPVRPQEMLETLELHPLADRPIDSLSTGERARAMLGRALAARPRLLLLDEPLSNLDPYWVLRTLEILRSELAASGGSALVSVHDLALLGEFDRALLVAGGNLLADEPPGTLLDSPSLSAAFGIERSAAGWRIRKQGDRRSSP